MHYAERNRMDEKKILDIYRLNHNSALTDVEIQRIKDAISLKDTQKSKQTTTCDTKRKKFCVIITKK